MNEASGGISLKAYSRICGVLYLVIIIAGLFAETFVRSQLIVSGDATATAKNIMASEALWRTGFACSIVMLLCDVGVSGILYILLKEVNRPLALLATLFRLTSISVLAIALLSHLSALFPLDQSDYLKAFNPEQLDVLAYLSLKAFSQGYNISLVFFGVHCFFLGYLIFKSGYFPKIVGMLLIICAFCYVINSFAWFLSPDFAKTIFPTVLIPAFIAELSLCLWLMIKGIDPSE